MKYQRKSTRKIRTILSLLAFACLSTLKCEALNTNGPLTLASAPGSRVTDDLKDLDVSASSKHAFLVSRNYGYGGSFEGPGGYGGGHEGAYKIFEGYPSGEEGSVYRGGSAYRGSGLTPGYRGNQVGGYGDEIIGGGHTGYGYYGITGYGSRDGGYGSGGQNTHGGIGSGLYDTSYPSYGGTAGGYGGYGDGYGNSYGGSYSGGYGRRDTAGYDLYKYRENEVGGGSSGIERYGVYSYQPSGYRGYS